MNKLDLIFEKQPPQVQKKLMNLLIQYNTMMQYNEKQDKFEVDLLLPFETPHQKQQFIQKFNSRTERRKQSTRHRQDSGSMNKREASRKGSYQSGQQNMILTEFNRNNQPDQYDGESYQHEKYINNLNREEQQEISLDFTNQNELSQRRNTLIIKDVSAVIKSKLKQAVQTIKRDKREQSSINQSGADRSHSNNNKNSSQGHDSYKGSMNLKKVEMDDDQNNMILHTLDDAHHSNHSHSKNKSSSHRNDTSNYSQKSTSRKQRLSEQKHPTFSEQSSQIKNEILIEQQDEQKYQNSKEHEDNLRQFENYSSLDKERSNEMSQQYPYIIEEGHEDDDDSPSSKNRVKTNDEKGLYTFSQIKGKASFQQKKKVPDTVRNVKQKLVNKYKSNKKINSSNIRQKYSQFLSKNYRDFDKLYDNIRKDIRRNQNQLKKSRKQDPILVLQQNISDVYSQQDRIFKEEVIKDYQKHIIVQNQNLSSQDLVRYFRYLLQHAKSLYVKNLFKPK